MKNTMLNKILGTMNPSIFDNFIHAHSIFWLMNVEAIATTPTPSDTMSAHFT